MANNGTFETNVSAPQTTHTETPHDSEADLSDAALLRRLRAGDREAFERVLEAARPRLLAVALKIVHSVDDAEDVVQDAMLKVWRHVDSFEGRAALSTWLHRIVANTAVDHLRSRRSAVVTLSRGGAGDEDGPRPAPEATTDETPEDSLARAEIGAVVRGGIARLSLVHREVLVLRELGGESYQAIAEIAGCPVGTVMSRLHHARQRLAETLAGDAEVLDRQAA